MANQNDQKFDVELFDPERIKGEAKGEFDQAKAKADEEEREQLKKKLIFSFVGRVGTGKSSMINAVLGLDIASVSPITGWTTEIQLYPFPGQENVLIADTPGLEDVNQEVSKRAEDFVEKDADVVLYTLNATAGVGSGEKKAYEALCALGRPVLVVINKMDALDEHEHPVLISDIRTKLSIPHNEEVVFPVSAKTGQGVEYLTAVLSRLCAKVGKELLFAKVARHKDAAVDGMIWKYAGLAFGIGALPIPGSDIGPLTGLQIIMLIHIAKVYGIEANKDSVLPLLVDLLVGKWAKAIFIFIAKAVTDALAVETAGIATPAVIAVSAVAGGIAGATTYGLGKAGKLYYKSGMHTPVEDLKKAMEAGAKAYKTKAAKPS